MSHPIIANTPENIKRPVIISSAAGYLQFRYRGQMHRHPSKNAALWLRRSMFGQKAAIFPCKCGPHVLNWKCSHKFACSCKRNGSSSGRSQAPSDHPPAESRPPTGLPSHNGARSPFRMRAPFCICTAYRLPFGGKSDIVCRVYSSNSQRTRTAGLFTLRCAIFP